MSMPWCRAILPVGQQALRRQRVVIQSGEQRRRPPGAAIADVSRIDYQVVRDLALEADAPLEDSRADGRPLGAMDTNGDDGGITPGAAGNGYCGLKFGQDHGRIAEAVARGVGVAVFQ